MLSHIKNSWYAFLASVALAALSGPPPAHAYQPETLTKLAFDGPLEGEARSVEGRFILQNRTENIWLVTASSIKTESYAFQVALSERLVEPGAELVLKFSGEVYRNGKFQINFPIQVRSRDEKRVQLDYLVDYYLLVRGQRPRLFYRVSDFEELFLKLGAKEGPDGRVFSSSFDDGSLPRAKDYEIKRPSLRRQSLKPDPESVYKIPTKSGVARQPIRPVPIEPIPIEPIPIEPIPIDPIRPRAAVSASGEFSFKGIDNVLYPAWGWRVRAWTRSPSGNWTKRAEDWVEWNGRWRLNFDRPAGHRVQFQYVAFNRYFRPQANNGDTYRWVGPLRSSIAASHNEGSWFADTSGGNVRGLGELYRDGILFWSKLYWEGEINPLRDDPIRTVYPNLSFDCGNGSGVPWSCANTGGNIWLIPTHGTNGRTMIHELGHQLNYEFWNNDRPPNSGGSHTLTGCFTQGLALLEGFANFMVNWTKTPRTAATPTFGFNIENPAGACATTGRNESWVAATFWDMHDQRFDGDDNLWFIHPGGVPGIYLRAGKKNSMPAFEDRYRNAANSEHESIISAIFEQNNN